MAWRPAHAMAAGGGLLLALAGPPFDFLPALWLGPTLLAVVLYWKGQLPIFASPARVALSGACRGLAFGFAANLAALRFIPGVITRFTPLPWVAGVLALFLLAAFEGLRWMIAGIAFETLRRVRVPPAWSFAIGVYAGTFVPTMIPWTLASGLSPAPPMIQLADIAGERGVTFVVALSCGLLATGLGGRPGWSWGRVAGIASAGAVIVLQAIFGIARIQAIAARHQSAVTARVALLNPAIPATTRWEVARAPAILSTLTSFTKQAEAEGAELVVWPEASYPYRIPHGSLHEPDTTPAILQPGLHGPVLTGLLMSGPDESAFNSAVVATRSGLSRSYDKNHLLWFGETVPLADRLPWIRRVFARGLGLSQGQGALPLFAGPVRAAVLICYEDTLPEAGRQATSTEPNLLVNITNDAWFGDPEWELHARTAALRAVEGRRHLVRAVNLGVTSWVDETGRVRALGSPDVAGVTMARPSLLTDGPTLYSRYGDWPWAFAVLLFVTIAVWRAGRASA